MIGSGARGGFPHENRGATGGGTSDHVASTISYHDGTPQVDTAVSRGVEQHAGTWLAASAVVVGAVGTEPHVVEGDAARGEELRQARLYGCERGLADDTAREAGLVADDDELEAEIARFTESFDHAGEKDDVGRIAHVARVDHERAVTIEEERSARHRQPRKASSVFVVERPSTSGT